VAECKSGAMRVESSFTEKADEQEDRRRR